MTQIWVNVDVSSVINHFLSSYATIRFSDNNVILLHMATNATYATFMHTDALPLILYMNLSYILGCDKSFANLWAEACSHTTRSVFLILHYRCTETSIKRCGKK